MRRLGIPTLTLLSILVLGLPLQALAQLNGITGWIDPATFSTTLLVGQTIEIDKNVWFDQNPYDGGGPCDGMAAEDCVGLEVLGAPSHISVGFEYAGVGTPGGGGAYGVYFDVFMTGLTPGFDQFHIGATILGASAFGVSSEEDNITVLSVPEPSTLLLLGAGLGYIGIRRRLKKRA